MILVRDYPFHSLPWNSLSPAITYSRRHIWTQTSLETEQMSTLILDVIWLYHAVTPWSWLKLCLSQPLCCAPLSVNVVTYPSATTLAFQNPTSVPRYRESRFTSSAYVMNCARTGMYYALSSIAYYFNRELFSYTPSDTVSTCINA